MKYVSVEEMIAIEKAADRAGHSYAAMMEAAGKGLARVIHRRFQDDNRQRVLALVGSGNNGGDALVALDYLLKWGWTASALILRQRDEDDPLIHRVLHQGGSVLNAGKPEILQDCLEKELPSTAVILDGVLGTGIKLPLRDPLDKLLEITGNALQAAASVPAVVAVDCPSGIDCDSGEAAAVCLPADLTVTMAAVKAGTLKFPAYKFLGELEIVDIGLPAGLPAWDRIKREVIQPCWVAGVVPDRPLDAHKGTFGTLLIAAGSRAYPGAAVLAGTSAYRIGAGLVQMAVPESIYSGLLKGFPEATWIVLPEGEDGIRESAAEKISETLGRPTACLLGPGWGTGRSTARFLEAVLELENLPPLAIDADGLRLLAGLRQWPGKLPAGSVLTPHPGEMAVLCGWEVSEIQADRVVTAEHFASEWGQIVLLKGAHTVIADPSGETRVLIAADPSLARAGSGDVLAGMIAGLIAQGVEPFSAAAAGAWLHARAGGLAGIQAGNPAAVLAGEISENIGSALGELTAHPG